MTRTAAVLYFDSLGVSHCEIALYLGLSTSRVAEIVRYRRWTKSPRRPASLLVSQAAPLVNGAMPFLGYPNRSASLCAAI